MPRRRSKRRTSGGKCPPECRIPTIVLRDGPVIVKQVVNQVAAKDEPLTKLQIQQVEKAKDMLLENKQAPVQTLSGKQLLLLLEQLSSVGLKNLAKAQGVEFGGGGENAVADAIIKVISALDEPMTVQAALQVGQLASSLPEADARRKAIFETWQEKDPASLGAWKNMQKLKLLQEEKVDCAKEIEKTKQDLERAQRNVGNKEELHKRAQEAAEVAMTQLKDVTNLSETQRKALDLVYQALAASREAHENAAADLDRVSTECAAKIDAETQRNAALSVEITETTSAAAFAAEAHRRAIKDSYAREEKCQAARKELETAKEAAAAKLKELQDQLQDKQQEVETATAEAAGKLTKAADKLQAEQEACQKEREAAEVAAQKEREAAEAELVAQQEAAEKKLIEEVQRKINEMNEDCKQTTAAEIAKAEEVARKNLATAKQEADEKLRTELAAAKETAAKELAAVKETAAKELAAANRKSAKEIAQVRNEYDATIAQLRFKNSAALQAKAASALQEANQEKQAHAAELTKLQAECDVMRAAIQEQLAKAREELGECTKRNAMFANAEGTRETQLKAEIEQLENKSTGLTEKIAAALARKIELDEQVEELTEKLKTCQTDCDTVQSRLQTELRAALDKVSATQAARTADKEAAKGVEDALNVRLSEQNDALQEATSALNAAKEAHQTAIGESTAQTEACQAAKADLERAQAASSVQEARLREELAAAAAEALAAKEAVQESAAAVKGCVFEKETVQSELASAREQLATANAAKEEAIRLKDAAKKAEAVVRQELEDFTKDLTGKQKMKRQREAQIRQLTKQLQLYTSRLKEEKKLSASHVKEAARLNMLVESRADGKNKALRDQKATLQREHAAAIANLQRAQNEEAERLKNEHAAAFAEAVAACERQAQKQTDLLKTLQGEQAAANAAATAAEQRNEVLTTLQTKQAAEMDTMKQTHAGAMTRLQKQLEDCKEDCEDANDAEVEVLNLQTQMEGLKDANAKLLKQLESLEASHATSTQRNQERNRQLTEELRAMRRKLAACQERAETSARAAQQTHSEQQRALDEAMNEASRLKETVASLKETIVNKMQEAAESKRELQRAAQDAGTYKLDVESYKKKLAKAEEQANLLRTMGDADKTTRVVQQQIVDKCKEFCLATTDEAVLKDVTIIADAHESLESLATNFAQMQAWFEAYPTSKKFVDAAVRYGLQRRSKSARDSAESVAEDNDILLYYAFLGWMADQFARGGLLTKIREKGTHILNTIQQSAYSAQTSGVANTLFNRLSASVNNVSQLQSCNKERAALKQQLTTVTKAHADLSREHLNNAKLLQTAREELQRNRVKYEADLQTCQKERDKFKAKAAKNLRSGNTLKTVLQQVNELVKNPNPQQLIQVVRQQLADKASALQEAGSLREQLRLLQQGSEKQVGNVVQQARAFVSHQTDQIRKQHAKIQESMRKLEAEKEQVVNRLDETNEQLMREKDAAGRSATTLARFRTELAARNRQMQALQAQLEKKSALLRRMRSVVMGTRFPDKNDEDTITLLENQARTVSDKMIIWDQDFVTGVAMHINEEKALEEASKVINNPETDLSALYAPLEAFYAFMLASYS